MIGAIALATIGAINIYSMKRWGKTGSAILASKVVSRTYHLGPFSSALITGLVFGLGFDSATQISALTLTGAASATLGVQVALILAGFFAIGMIPIDTLDSVVLRSAFSRIFNTKGFTYMAYALSGLDCGNGIILCNNQFKHIATINRSGFSSDNYFWSNWICFCYPKQDARTTSKPSPIGTQPKKETE